MKRITLSIIVSLVVVMCQAQEHLCFMDIPLDCSLETFCEKLVKEKNLIVSEMTEKEQYMSWLAETKKLTGDYYGIKNCIFFVRKHDRLDNVSSVMVEDTLSALSEIDAKRFISLHDEKYGKHEVDSGQSMWYNWKTANGDVALGLLEDGFRIYYIDYSENHIRKVIGEELNNKIERQTVKEICGIPFGTSYEQAKEILENKYGSPSVFSDKTTISYPNQTYAGISFDDIIFLFQSDGYKSYMNGCVFILDASSLSMAKEKQNLLYRELRLKYDMRESVDENGNIIYIGGYSPIPYDGFGFSIDILKYKDRSSIPYAARLMYGRYNYVKEEF